MAKIVRNLNKYMISDNMKLNPSVDMRQILHARYVLSFFCALLSFC